MKMLCASIAMAFFLVGISGRTLLAQAIDAQVQSGVNSEAPQASVTQPSTETALGGAVSAGRAELRIESGSTSQAGDGHPYSTGSSSSGAGQLQRRSISHYSQMFSQSAQSTTAPGQRLSAASAMQESSTPFGMSGGSSNSFGTDAGGQQDNATGEGSEDRTPGQGASSSATGSSSRSGTFPDSTQEEVGVSPPFGTNADLFSFEPSLPSFSVNFDAQHLKPNYGVSMSGAATSREEQNNNSLASFNPNNIQQNSPAQAPSTTPSDPIAAELQSILHPDQQRPNP